MVLVVSDIKEYILNNDCTEQILSELGCHHIVNKGEYITCGNKDGDNKQAITIYLNDNLTCVNYTRQISKDKRTHDIFDLISFVENISFFESLKWACDTIGLDYYDEPKELSAFAHIIKMCDTHEVMDVDHTPLKPISEDILTYYFPYPNKLFEDDNIPLNIQQEFEIRYDPATNYIVIPIRDELGSLVGIKGRWFGESSEVDQKYLYLERCNKSRLIYGYFQNKDYIKSKENDNVFVVESEKSVMQLAGMGFRNVVSTCGKTISKTQIELISRTACRPVFAFDKDVDEDELKSIANMFDVDISVYAIIDKDNILGEKESPSDNPNNWVRLVQNHIYKIK